MEQIGDPAPKVLGASGRCQTVGAGGTVHQLQAIEDTRRASAASAFDRLDSKRQSFIAIPMAQLQGSQPDQAELT